MSEFKTLKNIRQRLRDTIFKWGIEDGGDKLHFNEIIDEQFDAVRQEASKWITNCEICKSARPTPICSNCRVLAEFCNITEEDLK